MDMYEYGEWMCASKHKMIKGYIPHCNYSPFCVVQHLSHSVGDTLHINKSLTVEVGKPYGDRIVWGKINGDIAWTYTNMDPERDVLFTCQDKTMAAYINKTNKALRCAT